MDKVTMKGKYRCRINQGVYDNKLRKYSDIHGVN
jgi:hypothetical protein